MFTIKGRIVIAYTLLFGLMLGGFALVIYRSSRQTALDRIDGRLEAHADKVETEIEEELNEGTFPSSQEFLGLTTTDLHNLALQIYSGSTPLLSSTLPIPPIQYPVANGREQSLPLHEYTATAGGEDYRVLLSRPAIGRARNLLIALEVPLREVNEDLAHLELLVGISIPLSLLIAAIAAFIIIRSAFAPITRIAETARTISADDLEGRVTVPTTRDEVRDLAETFNSMLERLATAFQTQRQFIADASHEIRTPLTIIRSELEYAERIPETKAARESIGIALAETDNLAAMANSLLMLVRLEGVRNPLRSEQVALEEILLSAVERISKLAEQKGLEIRLEAQKEVVATADPDKLERAILNILDNAIKYSESGNAVDVHLYSEMDTALIVITDHGSGIPAADLPHIFERFHRSESVREQQGHGLGLAIAQRIVELHRGQITVDSIQGMGSSVRITLPLR